MSLVVSEAGLGYTSTAFNLRVSGACVSHASSVSPASGNTLVEAPQDRGATASAKDGLHLQFARICVLGVLVSSLEPIPKPVFAGPVCGAKPSCRTSAASELNVAFVLAGMSVGVDDASGGGGV